MSLIDDIRRDREACLLEGWTQSHREVNDGFRTQVFPTDDPDNTIATIHWHSVKTETGFRTDREKLGRRIARVPQMEAALLAAEELAKAADDLCERYLEIATGPEDISRSDVDVDYVSALRKVAAYRAATGAA